MAGRFDFKIADNSPADQYAIQQDRRSRLDDWYNLQGHRWVEANTGIYRINDLVIVDFDNETPGYAKIVEIREGPDNTDDDAIYFVVIQWLYSRQDVVSWYRDNEPQIPARNYPQFQTHHCQNSSHVLSNHYQVVTTENLAGLVTLGREVASIGRHLFNARKD